MSVHPFESEGLRRGTWPDLQWTEMVVVNFDAMRYFCIIIDLFCTVEGENYVNVE